MGTCPWVYEKSFGGFEVGVVFFLKRLILLAILSRARLWSNCKRPFASKCMNSGLSSRSFLSVVVLK